MKKPGLSLLFGIVLTFAGYGQAQAMGGAMLLLGMGMMGGMLSGSGGAMHGQHGAASGHGDGDAGPRKPAQEQASDGQRSVAGNTDQNNPKEKLKRPEHDHPADVRTH